jgi:hypothetical protein
MEMVRSAYLQVPFMPNAGVDMQLLFRKEPQVPLRIGIHIGDITIDDNGVYGDGVNIASRIESFAVAGSVFISDKVFDEIKNQTQINTTSMGMFKNKSYVNTTVREILQDVVYGTDIKLSDEIPVIPIATVWFKNFTKLQVLEYFKEKCLLTIYFDFDVLYCGIRAGKLKKNVKHRLNWNVIKDDSLLFNADKGFATVNIEVRNRSQSGQHRKGASAVQTPGNVKTKNVSLINDEKTLSDIAAEQKKILNNRGYSGSITAFLHPYAEPGMSTTIIDKQYKERNGKYFIESVSGSFGPEGGRQTIGIGFFLGASKA